MNMPRRRFACSARPKQYRGSRLVTSRMPVVKTRPTIRRPWFKATDQARRRMDIDDFSAGFFEEADDLIRDMEHLLLDLDIEDPDAEQLNAIFRVAHSIKGGAGAFGFTVL